MTTDYQRIAVIDIGKTNAKVVVIAAETGEELAGLRTPNPVRTDGLYPHFDTDRLWAFIVDALRTLSATPGFDAISITTHGACAALLDGHGDLALPVLDYEHAYPENVQSAYQALRPDFAKTNSPRLPFGLNLGAQLHFQKTMFPDAFARVKTIVTYPQYWAFRLTGVAAAEVTSLGCHTDLWNPAAGQYSDLVETLGIGQKLAPIRSAFDALGPLTAEVATAIGLKNPVLVCCGIHDSNASLLPHLIRRKGPFSVVSTGTWIIGFSVGSPATVLDPDRDTLANVDAFGKAVPSGRYMGGREFEVLTKDVPEPDDLQAEVAVKAVIANDIMLLPNVVSGSGPFPGSVMHWVNEPVDQGQRYAASVLYTALMTASSLSLIGAAGPIVVEGPFAQNRLYLRALASVSGRSVVVGQGGTPTGTAEGAALLTGITVPEAHDVVIPANLIDMSEYSEIFRKRVMGLGRRADVK